MTSAASPQPWRMYSVRYFMKRSLQIAGWTTVIALLVALPCAADDSAVLRNGFAIRHQRSQVIGTITRLYTNADNSSFVDIPTAEIDHFETLPDEAKPLEARKGAPGP